MPLPLFISGPNEYNWLKCGPENRASVIGVYFSDNSSTTDYILTTGALARLPVRQRGDRAARAGSCQCSLVLIKPSLSLQQKAYSSAIPFRDNTINQIGTSSSFSHITFLTSTITTVILFPSLKSDKPQLLHHEGRMKE